MQLFLLAMIMLFALSISETQAKGSELEEMGFSFVDSDDDGYDDDADDHDADDDRAGRW